MDKEILSKVMYESEFHNVNLVTVNGRNISGKVTLYESKYDSGKGEPCIGIGEVEGNNLFYLSNIKSLEIIDN